MIFKLIDKASRGAALVSRLLFIILIVSMLYEVVARYVLNASTIWAFDISYMATGAAFILGVAWTLQVDGHVKIDVIIRLLPEKVGAYVLGVAYTFLLCPVMTMMSWHGWNKAINAYMAGEVETVSTWGPLMWPFYLILAIGLSIFSLQLLAEGIRYFLEKALKRN
ncbi:TRAP transporter small permease subunit [Kushneria aurantia]|uniref:TRAP transporter small permease protein n=1 Tax=Kushneria aurantia TaxID=504092 RepID=A0ABV6FZF2_9GAMM|nr:TRAP transporter small permease subunit [Kushneria aurantia]